jgi:hypothetical protein
MRTSQTRLLGSAALRLVFMRTSQTRFPSASSGLRLTGSAPLRLEAWAAAPLSRLYLARPTQQQSAGGDKAAIKVMQAEFPGPA